MSPVRVLAQAVLQLTEAPACGTCRTGAELCLVECLLERRQRLARGVEVPRLERALDARHPRKDLRLLLRGRAEQHVEVRRRRAVHPGDLHVPAERDGADPVLDPLPAHLDEGRRKAEVEAARAHPDRARDEEVSRLVQEDQEGKPDDRDGYVHESALCSRCGDFARVADLLCGVP